MTFTLKSVVPWGRSFDEYCAMFNLTDTDFPKKILGCGDGPAGFNCEMHRRGYSVVSCDPVYEFSREQIDGRIREARAEVMEQVYHNQGNFVWDAIRSPEYLERVRLAAMAEFLEDYEMGKREGRYLPLSLPKLSFRDNEFDIALCSHFLFLYPELGYAFHMSAIREMARVAGEVRIYPTVDINGGIPPFSGDLIDRLQETGLCITFEPVGYHFLKNGTTMLKVSG
jgi:hypothetical protein